MDLTVSQVADKLHAAAQARNDHYCVFRTPEPCEYYQAQITAVRVLVDEEILTAYDDCTWLEG
jgi:hypothetical protein